MELVTGRAGSPHITSQQDRQKHQGIWGTGAYILNTGNNLEAVVQSSNNIQIKDGALMSQGALFSVKVGTVDEVTIANGSQGMMRKDVIVARYTYNQGANTENAEWAVVQGTPAASNPRIPQITEGDIQAGDATVDTSVFIVTLDGINITSVDVVPELAPDIAELKALIDKLNGKLPATTPLTSEQHGVIDFHGVKIVYGAYPLSAFTYDGAIQKYTADIDISAHKLTGTMWASVSALYNQGSPVVTLETVNTTRLSLISDVSIGGAQAMWVVIGASS